ncbi:hypothetical protein BGX29_006335 [Mortierella sp. GBA35]|nr:hypothetical protein BGX29_006335 [Mortierella sp. GBA35]
MSSHRDPLDILAMAAAEAKRETEKEEAQPQQERPGYHTRSHDTSIRGRPIRGQDTRGQGAPSQSIRSEVTRTQHTRTQSTTRDAVETGSPSQAVQAKRKINPDQEQDQDSYAPSHLLAQPRKRQTRARAAAASTSVVPTQAPTTSSAPVPPFATPLSSSSEFIQAVQKYAQPQPGSRATRSTVNPATPAAPSASRQAVPILPQQLAKPLGIAYLQQKTAAKRDRMRKKAALKRRQQEVHDDEEDGDGDDEDDDEEEYEEEDDHGLMPSELHLKSFIGHWKSWCRGQGFPDNDLITREKVIAYVKSMVTPGFILDKVMPPIGIPPFQGEGEDYIQTWTTMNMNILSIQVLYMRQCAQRNVAPDSSVVNVQRLESLLLSYQKQAQQTAEPIIPPPPGSYGPVPGTSVLRFQTAPTITSISGTSASQQPPNSALTNLGPQLPSASQTSQAPAPSDHPLQHDYFMQSALLSMEAEMFMRSLRRDIMKTVKRTLDIGKATQAAVASLGTRMDLMESSVRQSMLNLNDPSLSEKELREMEAYHQHQAQMLRQSRLGRTKGRNGLQGLRGRGGGRSIGRGGGRGGKRTDRQLREESDGHKEEDERPQSADYRQYDEDEHQYQGYDLQRYQSTDHSQEEDNDADEDQFYDTLPYDDEEAVDGKHEGMMGAEYAEETDGDEVEDELSETPIDLTEANYDVLPRKNATRSATSAAQADPLSDDFDARELNLLADEIASHYRQTPERKTLELYDPLRILPRNASLLEVWKEWFCMDGETKQPSIHSLNIYASGWHLSLEGRIKQWIFLKRRIIKCVIVKIQAAIEATAEMDIPEARKPTLKDHVRNALMDVEREIHRDGSINAFHTRIKRRHPHD